MRNAARTGIAGASEAGATVSLRSGAFSAHAIAIKVTATLNAQVFDGEGFICTDGFNKTRAGCIRERKSH
jgi:hypothetical protein